MTNGTHKTIPSSSHENLGMTRKSRSIMVDDNLKMLADTVGELVGKKSSVYRDIIKACTSANPLDLHLANDAFNGLPIDVRHKIAEKAKEIARHRADLTGRNRNGE